MKGEKLLYKTFFASLLVHVAGISMFGLVFPQTKIRRDPIEVSLLPPSTAPEDRHLARIDITPDIPRAATSYERLAIPMERETVEFSAEKFTVSAESVPIVREGTVFELPEYSVSFPSISDLADTQPLTAGLMASLEIEGIGGDRQLLHRKEIEYPDWARKRGLEGIIRIRFGVNPEGRIVSTGIENSSGFPELDIYAEENFRRWLFEPARTEREVRGIITLRFRLR